MNLKTMKLESGWKSQRKQRNDDIEFNYLLQKIDRRFGVKEIPETAQVK